jgi:hypothetical protein
MLGDGLMLKVIVCFFHRALGAHLPPAPGPAPQNKNYSSKIHAQPKLHIDMEAPKRMSHSPISSLPKPHAHADRQEPRLSITPNQFKSIFKFKKGYLLDLLCEYETNYLLEYI